MGWLKVQSRTDAVAISHRSALRVASIWFAAMDEPWAREGKLTSLPVLRHLLTSGVAAVNPTSEIKAAASAFSISFPLSDSDSTAYASASASAFAASAFAANASFSPSSPGGAVFDLAVTAAERYANASSDFWEQFRKDARCLQRGDDLLSLPLWSTPNPTGSNAPMLMAAPSGPMTILPSGPSGPDGGMASCPASRSTGTCNATWP